MYQPYSCSRYMSCCCSTIHDYFEGQFFFYKNAIELFLDHLLIHTCFFHDLENIFIYSSTDFYNVTVLLFVFHSTTILQHCLLMFVHHFFIRFSAYINHVFITYSTAFSGFLISSDISLYSLNIVFIETKS